MLWKKFLWVHRYKVRGCCSGRQKIYRAAVPFLYKKSLDAGACQSFTLTSFLQYDKLKTIMESYTLNIKLSIRIHI